MKKLLIEKHGATAVLTLNRPEQRNALDLELREELAETVAQVRDDDSVRAVVITGAGQHFCSGGDVKLMLPPVDGSKSVFSARERIRRVHRWFDELVDLEKPVIAAVDGNAFGVGISLALAADFVLCSRRASFCCVYARIGLLPDAGLMYLLPRAVGLSRAKELAFSARVVDSDEALQIGLVHQVCETDVLPAALAMAARFEHAPVNAIGITKTVMNRSFESTRQTVYAQEASGFALCSESAFHQEAVRRFLAKEPALYQWSEKG